MDPTAINYKAKAVVTFVLVSRQDSQEQAVRDVAYGVSGCHSGIDFCSLGYLEVLHNQAWQCSRFSPG